MTFWHQSDEKYLFLSFLFKNKTIVLSEYSFIPWLTKNASSLDVANWLSEEPLLWLNQVGS